MKRLVIMRHAKSAWDTSAPTDHARPLNERGRRDAPRMANELAARGWLPDTVISSDSERTRETWSRFAAHLDEPTTEVRFTRDLYHAGPTEIATACSTLDAQTSTAMVIGHNPGWESAVQYFTGVGEQMTTANCALLEADGGSWEDLMKPGVWRLVTVLRPKEL